MLDDVTDHQLPHLHIYPIMLTSSSRRHNRLPVNGQKLFKISQSNENAREWFQTAPATPLAYLLPR